MFVLTIPLTRDSLQSIKAELARTLPHVKSSHRCEAVGRGFGFATYASARAAIGSAISVTACARGDLFLSYLARHGFDVSANPFYSAAAKVALRAVASATPALTMWGMGVGSPTRKADGHWEDFRDMNARFVGAREELIGESAVSGFLASLAFLSRITPTRTIRNGMGSYGLKHVAENFICTYPEGGKLGPTYVSNGVFIAAAIHAGFRIKTYVDDLGYNNLNVSFNMSKPTLEQLDREIRGRP